MTHQQASHFGPQKVKDLTLTSRFGQHWLWHMTCTCREKRPTTQQWDDVVVSFLLIEFCFAQQLDFGRLMAHCLAQEREFCCRVLLRNQTVLGIYQLRSAWCGLRPEDLLMGICVAWLHQRCTTSPWTHDQDSAWPSQNPSRNKQPLLRVSQLAVLESPLAQRNHLAYLTGWWNQHWLIEAHHPPLLWNA